MPDLAEGPQAFGQRKKSSAPAGVRAGRTCTASRPHSVAANVVCSTVRKSNRRSWQQGQSARRRLGDRASVVCRPLQTSTCQRLCRQAAAWPVSSFRASTTWAAATVWITGRMTPAVSQVGIRAASGGSSKTQRRQGVSPGRMVIVAPWLPTAAP